MFAESEDPWHLLRQHMRANHRLGAAPNSHYFKKGQILLAKWVRLPGPQSGRCGSWHVALFGTS